MSLRCILGLHKYRLVRRGKVDVSGVMLCKFPFTDEAYAHLWRCERCAVEKAELRYIDGRKERIDPLFISSGNAD